MVINMAGVTEIIIKIDFHSQGPLLLKWFDSNPSMDK